MNAMPIATIITVPDTAGWGTVSYGGQTRLCYFDVARFVGFFAPLVSDRVLIRDGTTSLMAVAVLGKGAPS